VGDAKAVAEEARTSQVNSEPWSAVQVASTPKRSTHVEMKASTLLKMEMSFMGSASIKRINLLTMVRR
jgi:hypothetical protein